MEKSSIDQKTNTKDRICFFKWTKKNALEVAAYASLLATAAIVGSLTFIYLTRQQVHEYESQYELITDEALQRAELSLQRTSSGALTVAAMYSNLFPDSSLWPHVTLGSVFPAVAQPLTDTAKFTSSGMAPMITTSTSKDWETFAYSTFDANPTLYTVNAGQHSFGEGIFAVDPALDTADNRYHDTTGNTTWGSPNHEVMFPLIDVSDPINGESSLTFNLHSSPARGSALDTVIDCVRERAQIGNTSMQCGALSDVTNLDMSDDSSTRTDDEDIVINIYQPIYPVRNRTVLVGVSSVSLKIRNILNEIVPNLVKDLIVEVRDSSAMYSYVLCDGDAKYLGGGAFHDSKFDSYARSRVLSTSDFTGAASVYYTLTFYPTEKFVNSYQTTLPLKACIGSIAVVLMTAIIFGLYDYFTHQASSEKKEELKMKRLLVRFISHEVRTPLNAVMMGLQLFTSELSKLTSTLEAGENGEGNKDQEEEGTLSAFQRIGIALELVRGLDDLMKDIHVGTESAALVLDDLLYYDTIHFQTVRLEKKAVPLWRMIRQELVSFETRAKHHGVVLRMDLELWSAEVSDERKLALQQLMLMGDVAQIAQVVKVLMGNALKYSPPGSEVTIRASWSEEIPVGVKCRRHSVTSQARRHSSVATPPPPGQWNEASEGVLSSIKSGNTTRPPPAASTASPVSSKPSAAARVGGGGGGDRVDEYLPRGVITLSVTDSGNGICAEELKKIKKEGIRFQLENLNVGESIALNQEVAATIVQRHGGLMSVQSEGLGKGSTFVVTLPVYVNATAAAAAAVDAVAVAAAMRLSAAAATNITPSFETAGTVSCSMGASMRSIASAEDILSVASHASIESDQAVAAPRMRKSGHEVLRTAINSVSMRAGRMHPRYSSRIYSAPETMRALVVDDVASNRKMLMRLLKREGFECVEASDGQEAVDAVLAREQDEPFDLICMDFEMPVMTGPTATKVLRERGCGSLVIGVTGNVLPADVTLFMQHGANAVLAKPLQLQDLMQVWLNRDEYMHTEHLDEVLSPPPPPFNYLQPTTMSTAHRRLRSLRHGWANSLEEAESGKFESARISQYEVYSSGSGDAGDDPPPVDDAGGGLADDDAAATSRHALHNVSAD